MKYFMYMVNIVVTITFISLPFVSSAEHKGHSHAVEEMESTIPVSGIEGAACKDTIHVKVNGLVCDFCARALEKIFSKQKNVVGINVDLDKGSVKIAMQPGKTMDKMLLIQLITDSGYNVTAIDKGC